MLSKKWSPFVLENSIYSEWPTVSIIIAGKAVSIVKKAS